MAINLLRPSQSPPDGGHFYYPMELLMIRFLLALACAAPLAGCAMGQPASLAPASRQAISPVSTFGFQPVVRQAIGLPVGATRCVTGFLTRGLTDAVQTLDCVLDTLIPIVTPPAPGAQSAPQYAPAPQRAPGCESVATCANGNCSVNR